MQSIALLSNIGNHKILNYLTPLIPLSFEGEGEILLRGANAPLNTPFLEDFVTLAD